MKNNFSTTQEQGSLTAIYSQVLFITISLTQYLEDLCLFLNPAEVDGMRSLGVLVVALTTCYTIFGYIQSRQVNLFKFRTDSYEVTVTFW